jgi:hypothetical protein
MHRMDRTSPHVVAAACVCFAVNRAVLPMSTPPQLPIIALSISVLVSWSFLDAGCGAC